MALKLLPPGARKNNPYYLAVGWHNGRPFERSLKTKDPEEAEDLFYALRKELRGQGAAGPFTFADAVDLYEETHPVPTQLARWHADLKKQLGAMQAAKITNADLRRAALKLYPRSADSTRNRQVIVPAAAVLHWAAEAQRIPWLRVKKFSEPDPEALAVTRDVALRLINGAALGQERTFLRFLFAQGWRISEALRLTWDRVELVERTIAYQNRKTKKWIVVALADEAWEALTELAGSAPRVGRVFSWGNRSNVYRWLGPLTKKLGVRFTPHMARHSFATWKVNEDVDTLTLMAIGGWRDPKSVKRYGSVSRERERAALRRGTLGKI
jgi:integrase